MRVVMKLQFMLCTVLLYGIATAAPRAQEPVAQRASINITDPHHGPTLRHYAISVPSTYKHGVAMPLLMWFHGQGDAWPAADTMKYQSLGEQHGFLTVYPRGYGDWHGKDRAGYIAWNVGLLDRGLGAANRTCFEDTEPTCYDSCKQCSRCSWSTCVDDVGFIVKLLASLRKEYSIDADHVFATGASNGGMFTHHLAARVPTMFRAMMPIYGLPLFGMLAVPSELAGVPILQMHDRGDETIPWAGGMTSDGWIYESITTTLSVWARVHGCQSSVKLRGVNTPFDGGNQNFECQEYKHCRQGRVIQCFFDGQHGAWPASGQIEDIGWWFFAQSMKGGKVPN